jgi:ferredoxin
MAHKKQGYRFENDWDKEWLETGANERWKQLITIPVDTKIISENTVLNLDEAMKYIEKARTVTVLDCFCRILRNNCDAPLDVCILLDDKAEHVMGEEESPYLRNKRIINKEEAVEVMNRAHEAGLVLTAQVTYDFPGAENHPGRVFTICGCCSCCCCQLSAVLRYGLAPHLLSTHTSSVTDSSKCTSCGVCVDRCQFGARTIVDGSLTVDSYLCFGCGLCASTCPAAAVSIVEN